MPTSSQSGHPKRAAGAGPEIAALPELTVAGSWHALLEPPGQAALEALLPAYLRDRRWFRGKARTIKAAAMLDAIPVPLVAPRPAASPAGERSQPPLADSAAAFVVPLRVDYDAGDSETYVLPLGFAPDEAAGALYDHAPQAVIARLTGGSDGLLYDAMWDPAFSAALLAAIASGQALPGRRGTVVGEPTSAFDRVAGTGAQALPPVVGRAEQSNTSVAFGDRLIMKLFRRIEEGINPDLEVTRFLTEETDFTHSPPVAGSLAYRTPAAAERQGSAPAVVALGILQGFVPNQGDARAYTLAHLGDFLTHVRAETTPPPPATVSTANLLDLATSEPPALARRLLGDYLDSAGLLGRRTAEMHLALASRPDIADFAPEPFTPAYQRSLYQSTQDLCGPIFALLGRLVDRLPADIQDDARVLAGLQDDILARVRSIAEHPVHAVRMRTHGDYHLGQVLYTGSDFVIIDFEGEPGHPLAEGRAKRGALRDVAGMLRSFQYAAYGRMLFDAGSAQPAAAGHEAASAGLESWARFWQVSACAAFLKTYLAVAGQGSFLPTDRRELELLLDSYLLEKAVYELGYELNNRPAWVSIPIRSILGLLRPQAE